MNSFLFFSMKTQKRWHLAFESHSLSGILWWRWIYRKCILAMNNIYLSRDKGESPPLKKRKHADRNGTVSQWELAYQHDEVVVEEGRGDCDATGDTKGRENRRGPQADLRRSLDCDSSPRKPSRCSDGRLNHITLREDRLVSLLAQGGLKAAQR